MKRSISSMTLILVMSVLQSSIAFAQQASARAAGSGSSGGGDAVVADFVSTAADIYGWLLENAESSRLPITALQFSRAIDPTRVESTKDDLAYRGVQVDAYYCAEVDGLQCPRADVIRVNRVRWNAIVTVDQKWKLVAHELFRRMKAQGVQEAEDDAYQLSKVLVAKAFAHETEMVRRLNSMQGRTFKSSECTVHVEVDTKVSPHILVLQPNDCSVAHLYPTMVMTCKPKDGVVCVGYRPKVMYSGRFAYYARLLPDGNFIFDGIKYHRH